MTPEEIAALQAMSSGAPGAAIPPPPGDSGLVAAPPTAADLAPPPMPVTPPPAPIPAPQAAPPSVGYAPGGPPTQPSAPPALPMPNRLPVEEAMRLARQGQGPRMPAHWQGTTRSMERSGVTEYSPETLAAMGRSLTADQDVMVKQAAAESAQAKAASEVDKRAAIYDQATALQEKLRADHEAAQLAEERRKIAAAVDDAAADKPDRMKWFKDMGGFSKFMTGLGLALQGFVFGASGKGGNPDDWINSQIQHSLNEQEAAHRNKREKIGEMRTGYAELKSQLGDEDRTRLVHQAEMRAMTIAEIQRQAAERYANDPMAQLRASQLVAALEKSQAQTMREVDEKTQGQVKTSANETFRQASGGGPTDPLTIMRRAAEIEDLYPKITGGSLGEQKEQAEVAKLQGEAEKLRREGGGGGADPRQLEELAKQTETAGLPSAQHNLARAQELVRAESALGSLPGTVFPAMRAMAMPGTPGSLAYQAASPAQRELFGTLKSLAEAKAHANGQRGQEAIEYNLHTIVGNGSREDVERGIASARADIAARQSTILAGATPATQAEFTRRQQVGGVLPPPGVTPGALPAEGR